MSSNPNSLALKLLIEQRRRLVASLMSHAEDSPWWRRLSSIEQAALRGKVRDAVGVYYDFSRDLVRTLEDDAPNLNEEAVRLVASVHAMQSRLEAALNTRG